MISGSIFDKYWNFSRRLIQHCNDSDNFYNHRLLKLVCECLGYPCASISKYNKGEFSGIIIQLQDDNAYSRWFEGHYAELFLSVDPFAKALTRNNNLLNQPLPLVLSSAVLQTPEETETYENHLLEKDMKWSLGIPFGSYRLCINKSKDDSDFTTDELSLIRLVSELIYSKSVDFKNIYQSESFFKNMQIGKVTFSSTGEIITCNDLSLRFLRDVLNITNINSIPRSLLDLFEKKGVSNNANSFYLQKFMHENYRLTVANTIRADGFGIFNKTWYVSIEEISTETDNDINYFKKKYGLSLRETEITEALANGSNPAEIAEKLHISLSTVRTHIKNIFCKTNVNSQALLMKKYYTD